MADRKNNLRMSGATAFASGQRGPSSSSGTRMKPNTVSIDTKKVRDIYHLCVQELPRMQNENVNANIMNRQGLRPGA